MEHLLWKLLKFLIELHFIEEHPDSNEHESFLVSSQGYKLHKPKLCQLLCHLKLGDCYNNVLSLNKDSWNHSLYPSVNSLVIFKCLAFWVLLFSAGSILPSLFLSSSSSFSSSSSCFIDFWFTKQKFFSPKISK